VSLEPDPALWADFARCASAWGLSLTSQQLGQFQRYLRELGQWNQRFNLTRITAPQEVLAKHLLDSLSCATVLDFQQTRTLIDVGTGAGFPGLALKIAFPALRVVLLDSTEKRLRFCRSVADLLGLEEVESLHARAEEAAHDPRLREHFDVVTARAVARLTQLVEWTLPFARRGGSCIAMKGPEVEAEVAEAAVAIARYGGAPPSVTTFELPIVPVGRSLVVIPKRAATPPDLPRGPAPGPARKRAP
jgi:16S rRNA (guanine527-N7)-methyltransferase